MVASNPPAEARMFTGLPPWLRTLRAQVALSLALLFVLLATSVGFTLYELSLRRHDYQILNLAGQLRVTAGTLRQQARNYQRDTPTDYSTYTRDLGLFYADLMGHVALIDRIMASFAARRLDRALTGRDEALTCRWDAPSRQQLDKTAGDWQVFRAGLMERLGNDPAAPRLNFAADYIVAHGEALSDSTDSLARGFQAMMEAKLARIQLHNQGVLGVAALIMLALVLFLYRNLVCPLRRAIAGFDRVARGDLGHQVPVQAGNEIGQMTRAFNDLSRRLHALFRLTDRINLGRNLDDTLGFVRKEFSAFLPVDWVGVLLPAPEGGRWVLDRQHGPGSESLPEGASFSLPDPDIERALQTGRAVQVHGLDVPTAEQGLAGSLNQAGFASSLILPAGGGGEGVAMGSGALLVFAARQAGAYSAEHGELLENVAGQLSHALDRTVFLERLVVAAVQGLAKLAESRDPETGDHLVRMALYSAIVAEELGRAGPYREHIDAAYVRAIHQFAPMHDIGKVGISDAVLLKPGLLDGEERADMQRHPAIGGQVLRRCEAQVNDLGHSIFQVAIEIAEAHHERFDGSGYPAGLAGQAIPLSARIVAVADVFDALTSRRPYKAAWSVDAALEAMERDAGRHYDPEVLAALKRALSRVLEVYGRLKHV